MGTDTLLSQIRAQLPLQFDVLELSATSNVGLVVVDEVNGFCTVGCGNLAPPVPNKAIFRMVGETDKLARQFSVRGWPILCFLDSHHPDRPEPPYPLHCVIGTGEENLVPDLEWLEKYKNAVLMRKDCINGFVGGMQSDGSNIVIDWIKQNHVENLLVVGICTDICVMDFVSTALSARNHGVLGPLKEVCVYTDGCSTYDLPTSVANSMGALGHPQELTHYMGLYFAKSRGARLVEGVVFRDGPQQGA